MTPPVRVLPEERKIINQIMDITGRKPRYSCINYEVFHSRVEYLEYLKKTLQEEKEKRGITD